MTRRRLLAVAASLIVTATGCTGSNSENELLVSAAASLTDAFNGIALAYEAEHSDIDVRLNFAGSSTLREQILNGAPADVVITANPETMDPLVSAGLTAGEPMVFATNRMTIAVPAGNLARVVGLADFADPDLLIGLCAEPVPCGTLARRVFERAGFTPVVDTNEPDVRALLTKLEADELDAGIVYVTDVVGAAGAVEAIAIADALNPPTTYPIAVLDSAANRDTADDFVAFVLSERGRDILARHGFELP